MKKHIFTTSAFVLIGALISGTIYLNRQKSTAAIDSSVAVNLPQPEAVPQAKISPPQYIEKELVIEANSTFYQALSKVPLDAALIHNLVASAKESFDLAKIPAQTVVKVYLDEASALKKVLIDLSRIRKLEIIADEQNSEGWRTRWIDIPVTKIEKTYAGKILVSLWESAFEAGLDEKTIQQMAEIFGWQIDFERQVQPDDSWKIVVEYLTVEGEFFEFGNIMAAEYGMQGNSYKAFRFPQSSSTERGEYYDAEGQNLKSKFLKSPLKFGRISSRFQKARFHPILGVNRPHNGVDYAAPTGTPVRAVGDGVIALREWNGSSGNTVNIRHNAIYKTAYKHLSKFNLNFKKGSRVKQGDVIGYVGSTGLATGPHLHFEFYEHGKYTDPLGKKFPREEPLADALKPAFLQAIGKYQELLALTASKDATPSKG